MAIAPISPVAVAKPPPARRDTPRLGLIYMFAGMAMFAATDAIAKLLTDSLSPIQIVWSRQCGLMLGVLVILAVKGLGVLRTSHLRLQVARGVLAVFSATLFIIAIAYVPLADAVAITFVAPFMVTLLAALVLKEPVGLRRWSAVIIGFIGTLIVIRPGLGVMHPAAFLLMIAATLFALRQILSRALAGDDRPVTTVAYTALISWGLLCLPLPFVWQTPASGQEVALLVLIALLAAGGETLVILALATTQAVVVAPVQYSLLLWGTMYGFLIFGQLPDGWTLLGALILVATGVYTIRRESAAQQRRGTDDP